MPAEASDADDGEVMDDDAAVSSAGEEEDDEDETGEEEGEEGGEEETEEEDEPVPPPPGHVSHDLVYYFTVNNDTPETVAEKLGCDWKVITEDDDNMARYGRIARGSKFEASTALRIPESADKRTVRKMPRAAEEAMPAKASDGDGDDEVMEDAASSMGEEEEDEDETAAEEEAEEDEPVPPPPGHVSHDLAYYFTVNDDTPETVAELLGCDWKDITDDDDNMARYGRIARGSKFEASTALRIPETADGRTVKKLPRAEPVSEAMPDADAASSEGEEETVPPPPPGHVSHDLAYYYTVNNDTPETAAELLGCNWKDITEDDDNAARYGRIARSSKFEASTALRIPESVDGAKLKKLPRAGPPPPPPRRSQCNGKTTGKRKSRDDDDDEAYEESPEPPQPGTVCRDRMYYSTMDDETPESVAVKLGCGWRDVVEDDDNASRYGRIARSSRFEEGTLLRVPKSSDSKMVGKLVGDGAVATNTRTPAQKGKAGAGTSAAKSNLDPPEPGCVRGDLGYYCTIDDETCGQVARKLGCRWKDIAEQTTNRRRFGEILYHSRFEERTYLRIPEGCCDEETLKGLVQVAPVADEGAGGLEVVGDGAGSNEADLEKCCVCSKLEDPNDPTPMLLCDACDAACHLGCAPGNLSAIPEDDWYCPACQERLDSGVPVLTISKKSFEAMPGARKLYSRLERRLRSRGRKDATRRRNALIRAERRLENAGESVLRARDAAMRREGLSGYGGACNRNNAEDSGDSGGSPVDSDLWIEVDRVGSSPPERLYEREEVQLDPAGKYEVASQRWIEAKGRYVAVHGNKRLKRASEDFAARREACNTLREEALEAQRRRERTLEVLEGLLDGRDSAAFCPDEFYGNASSGKGDEEDLPLLLGIIALKNDDDAELMQLMAKSRNEEIVFLPVKVKREDQRDRSGARVVAGGIYAAFARRSLMPSVGSDVPGTSQEEEDEAVHAARNRLLGLLAEGYASILAANAAAATKADASAASAFSSSPEEEDGKEQKKEKESPPHPPSPPRPPSPEGGGTFDLVPLLAMDRKGLSEEEESGTIRTALRALESFQEHGLRWMLERHRHASSVIISA